MAKGSMTDTYNAFPESFHQFLRAGFCLVAGIIVMLYGVSWIRKGLERQRLAQNSSNIPSSKATSAAIGLAEFHGKAFPMRPMVSPISRQKCAYYYLEVKVFHRFGKSGSWRTLYCDLPSDPFYLEDETGRILVNPSLTRAAKPGGDKSDLISGKVALSKIDLQPANVFKGHISPIIENPLTPKIDQKVLEYIESSPRIKARFEKYQSSALEITEYYIPEGEEIYIIGSVLPIEGATSSMGNENLVVREAEGGGTFYMGTSPEQAIVKTMNTSALFDVLIGAAIAGFGLLVFLLPFFFKL